MNPFIGKNTQNVPRNKLFRCCVTGCKTRSSNGFHNFPTNEDICLEWMERIQKLDWDVKKLPKSFHRVCKKHFRDSDFYINMCGKKRLKKAAVPSQNLPEVNEHLSEYQERAIDLEPWLTQEDSSSKKRKDNNGAAISVAHFQSTDYGEEIKHVIEEAKRTKEYNDGVAANSINSEEKMRKLKLENAQLRIKLRKNQKTVKLLRQKIKANKIDNARVIEYLSKIFNDKQMEFFKMQLRNSGKKNRGQRYTMEQKSLSLSIYKHGPKCYRFMQKIFALPCKRTLQRHNAYLHFEAGVDRDMLEFIKEKVKDLPAVDRYCFICWDEQSLKAHLDLNHNNDMIDGFVDFGHMRRPTFATHSLAFMVRGINSGFKQAVGFFYTDNIKSFELAEIVRLVTEAVLDTGLTIIGSTCDQVQINVAAINRLIDPNSFTPKRQDGKLLKYKIRDTEIIHCYDLPHLLKVIRNNLLSKDLEHCISKHWDINDSNDVGDDELITYTACWSDIVDVYETDLKGSQRLLKTNITNEHVKPDKLKMKVCVATQVFSRTFGNVMLHFSNRGHSRDYFGTAQVLLFFNDLFDSLNGSDEPQQDTLLGSVNENSIHFVYWEYALKMLSQMTFIDRETEKTNNKSSVILKFMSTIRGYMELTKICFNLNMKQVALRNGNQDGLENMFGGVNSCNHVSKPIATQFKTGYATMLINNLSSGTSLSTNCEKDNSKPLLNNVHEMLLHRKAKTEKIDESLSLEDHTEDCNDIIIFDPEILNTKLDFVEDEAITYISSVVCRKLLEKTDCDDCMDNLQTSSKFTAYDIISKLSPIDYTFYKNPSSTFLQTFKRLFHVSSQIVPDLCHEKFLRTKIVKHLENEIVNEVGCCDHKEHVMIKLKHYAAYYAITDFIKSVNNLLSGKVTILPENPNHIQELALIFRNKNKHKGKYSDKFIEECDNSKEKIVKTKPLKPKIVNTKNIKPKVVKPKNIKPKVVIPKYLKPKIVKQKKNSFLTMIIN